MSIGINKVILLGFVGKDPELNETGKSPYLRVRLGTTERLPGAGGAFFTRTEWLNVVVYGRRATSLAKILKKNDQVLIDGRIQTTSSTNEFGHKSQATEVIAASVLLTGKVEVESTSVTDPVNDLL